MIQVKRQSLSDQLGDPVTSVRDFGADLQKRQIGGILGDKPATPDGDNDPNTQVSTADDGTNGENSFDAQGSAAKDTEADTEADTEDAAAAKEDPAAGLLGDLGL